MASRHAIQGTYDAEALFEPAARRKLAEGRAEDPRDGRDASAPQHEDEQGGRGQAGEHPGAARRRQVPRSGHRPVHPRRGDDRCCQGHDRPAERGDGADDRDLPATCHLWPGG